MIIDNYKLKKALAIKQVPFYIRNKKDAILINLKKF